MKNPEFKDHNFWKNFQPRSEPQASFIASELIEEQVYPQFANLTERDLYVVNETLGLETKIERNYSDVGREMNISGRAVKRIQKRALKKMKDNRNRMRPSL